MTIVPTPCTLQSRHGSFHRNEFWICNHDSNAGGTDITKFKMAAFLAAYNEDTGSVVFTGESELSVGDLDTPIPANTAVVTSISYRNPQVSPLLQNNQLNNNDRSFYSQTDATSTTEVLRKTKSIMIAINLDDIWRQVKHQCQGGLWNEGDPLHRCT
jgi:hypothetical protein